MTAIVTGASRGIGRAIATDLAKTHQVIGTYRGRLDAAESLRSETGAGIFPCDISIAADREALIAHAWERFGSLDLLVNNAGLRSGSAGTFWKRRKKASTWKRE